MSPEQIKRLVRGEVQAQMSANRFRITPIPRHTHNGTDSPLVSVPFFPYGGLIGITEIGILPQGWTVIKNDTGDFTVTHNLGTNAYIVTASSVGNSGLVDITPDQNAVEFSWSDKNGNKLDTPFYFIILTVTNKNNNSYPNYQSTDWLDFGVLL